MNDDHVGSKDGSGACDQDQPYRWGLHPSVYLAERFVARLIALRGIVQDIRAGVDHALYDLSLERDLAPATDPKGDAQ